jgi:hypothetical protein
VFCSYNATSTIENDTSYKENIEKYTESIKEVSREDLFLEILSHTNLMTLQEKSIKSEKNQQELINSSVIIIV